MAWWDYFKIWSYAFNSDPQSELKKMRDLTGAGHSQPDALPDIRSQDGSYWGGGRGLVRLRDSQDFIDLSTITNRQSRYKEYERLRNVPEIETAMTVFADEACLAGSCKIATPFYGDRSIKWFTENVPNERFLVYCWDFEKNDYTLGWAYHPRKVKRAKTIKIKLENGDSFTVTHDHQILMRTGDWRMAGQLKKEDELMPFYRLEASRRFSKEKGITTSQFPRIFTFKDGWKHERQFIDEWRTGKSTEHYQKVNQACRILAAGLSVHKCAEMMGNMWNSINKWLRQEGFTLKELRALGQKEDRVRIMHIEECQEQDVYDLSVEDHKNFCGTSMIYHNCQIGENKHVAEITCDNDAVTKELEWLLFHRKMLNLDRRAWHWMKQLCIFGDYFLEKIIDPENPKDGILKVTELPADSVYRIETTKGKLVEFQQSNEGPDYQSLTRPPVPQATDADLQQATAIRFDPHQVVHMKIGDDRKTFYPYGVSLIEPARGPAHQLRLMEDAMVVYRLCLTGDTRVRTANGWKYIKDLKIGDLVFSYCVGTREPFLSKIIDWQNNGKQKIYQIRTKHIEIKGNATHPIWVEREGVRKYVELQNVIAKKDKLLNISRESNVSVEIPTIFGDKWAKLDWSQKTAFKNTQYKNKSELMRQCSAQFDRVKQFLYADGKSLPYEQAVEICEMFSLNPNKLQILNKGQINAERINLPKQVDEEFAQLFGFLIGDGSIRNHQIQFSAGEDWKLNHYYENLLKKYFGKIRFEKDKRSKKGLGNYVVDSTIASKIFTTMGYIAGAHNKRIPDWVFTCSKSIRKAFIIGLSHADGCERTTKNGTWFSTIELCNEKLVADIKELWSSIGLCSGILKKRYRKHGHKIFEDRVMPASISYIVTISEKELPEKENIISINILDDEEDVFDITVNNEEHNFIANGTIVHNTRAPERRVFYIDVGSLPSFKAEAFMERMKDQFRKKKVGQARNGGKGASAVEERWHAPSADEDYWIPTRPNSNTRVETLPGAQNLGEIDDAVYFRNKLYTALNFPKNYQASEDANATRITLSNQDVKFAKLVERLQASLVDGLLQISETHLELRGYPEEAYESLQIEMTPPSAWRELNQQEIIASRISNATGLKGSMLMSDFDILTKWMHYSEEQALEMISRNKIQKLEDLKLQIVGQNPQLLGIGSPADEGEQQMGVEAGGPNPMLGPEQQVPGGETENAPPEQQIPPQSEGGGGATVILGEPTEDEIKKYNMGIQNYASEIDDEEIDYSTV